MTVSIAEFYPYVMPDVVGVSRLAAKRYIRDAAIRFCADTSWWVLEATGGDIVEDDQTYQIVPPGSHGAVHRIVSVSYNDTPLTKINRPPLSATSAKTPTQYLPGIDNGEFTIYPTPSEDVTGALGASVVMKPAREDEVLEDSLFERWVDVIAAGAKAALMAQPGKNWTNPEFSQMNILKFNDGMRKAKIDALIGRGIGFTSVNRTAGFRGR